MAVRIGFIGLGNMGIEMATRLLSAGLEPHVWNRSKQKAQPLADKGAHVADRIEEVLQECPVVLSMLSNDAAVDQTFSDEVLRNARGGLHVNMATVSLATSRVMATRHAEHGVRYVAAPVLGRPEVAAAGQLNIVAAGSSADLDEADLFLAHLGKQVWRVGDKPEQASLVKIGFNYNLIHALQALGESVALIERGGIDGQVFVDILTDVAFSGTTYRGYGSIIAQRNYQPAAFSLELGLKDLGLAESAAAELGAVLPTAPTMRAMFEEAVADDELNGGDWSVVAEVIRRGPGR